MVFPKTRRLTSNPQFKAVLDRGRRAGDGLLTLYAAANDRGYPRLGVSVGKSSGKAVVRNRLKRLLREAFRQSQDRIPQGFDYVLMISPALSRKLKAVPKRGAASAGRRKPSGKPVALRTLSSRRMQESFLSLAASAARDPSRNKNRTDCPDHVNHE